MARAPLERTIDVYPEADRLGEFPHPRYTNAYFGHAAAEAQLAAGLHDGKLHHAWLLSGPVGVGKATLAYRFARAALSKETSDTGLFGDAPTRLDVASGATASHLVRALSHPDLLVIRRPYDIKGKRFKTAITVDEVRRLRDFLGHKQIGGGWKVVIVDSADEMNVNAANALLKSLEEPPKGAIFFLISSMPGRLLATIRSRCRLLNFSELDDDSLKAAATEAMRVAEVQIPDEGQWGPLLQASGGSVGKLLSLATDDGIQLAKKVDQVFGNLVRTNWTDVHQLCDEFSAVSAAERFEAFTELLLARLGRAIRAAATNGGEPTDVQIAEKLSISSDLASWAELWETLVREKALQGGLNLDRKAYVLDCVMRLRRLAAGA